MKKIRGGYLKQKNILYKLLEKLWLGIERGRWKSKDTKYSMLSLLDKVGWGINIVNPKPYEYRDFIKGINTLHYLVRFIERKLQETYPDLRIIYERDKNGESGYKICAKGEEFRGKINQYIQGGLNKFRKADDYKEVGQKKFSELRNVYRGKLEQKTRKALPPPK